MKSLLYHGFGIKGYRYRRTRYEKGRSSSSWSRALPDEEADTSWISVAGCAHGAIGLKPVVLRVKVPRWLNTTTGEEFEQFPPHAIEITRRWHSA
jgi:hypothetical protein